MRQSVETLDAAGSKSETRSMLRERLSAHMPKAPPHVPDFATRDQDEFILISDGGKPVATFHRQWLMLDLREFYPDGRTNATLDIRRPYHNVDFRGTIFPCNWKHKSQMVDSTANTVSIIEILDSHTAAIGCSTCSAFYDEHILLGCPAPLDDTGKYRWRFHCRLVSIPEPAMALLRVQATPLEMSDTPDQYDDWRFLDFIRSAGRHVQPFDISLPFRLGEVNHFDAPIDPRKELIGLYWYFNPQPYGRVTWDRAAHSLLLEGFDTRTDLSSVPCGPSIRCHENTGHRLSATVRAELADGAAAWLELSPFLYSPTGIKEPMRSPRLTGVSDGTTIPVAIPPSPGKDYLAVALRLKGKGRAWFDEVSLVRVGEM